MAITIFKDRNFKGPNQVVTCGIRDLKNQPVDKPGSMNLSASTDAVLLYKNDDWHGGALFARGDAIEPFTDSPQRLLVAAAWSVDNALTSISPSRNV